LTLLTEKGENVSQLYYNAIRALTDEHYVITIRADKDFDIQWLDNDPNITKQQILDKREELES